MLSENGGVLGPGPIQGDVSEIACLNHVFRWFILTCNRPEDIDTEQDERH